MGNKQASLYTAWGSRLGVSLTDLLRLPGQDGSRVREGLTARSTSSVPAVSNMHASTKHASASTYNGGFHDLCTSVYAQINLTFSRICYWNILYFISLILSFFFIIFFSQWCINIAYVHFFCYSLASGLCDVANLTSELTASLQQSGRRDLEKLGWRSLCFGPTTK